MRKIRCAMAAAAVAGLIGAPPALAGESTGNFSKTGKTTPIASYVAKSICSFSGQNPEVFLEPNDPEFEPGRTQSWGQIPKEFRDAPSGQFHPGNSCNGHTGFFSGGGE